MIIQDELILLKFSQLLFTTAIINVWGEERRNCSLMLGFKGLKGQCHLSIFTDHFEAEKNICVKRNS